MDRSGKQREEAGSQTYFEATRHTFQQALRATYEQAASVMREASLSERRTRIGLARLRAILEWGYLELEALYQLEQTLAARATAAGMDQQRANDRLAFLIQTAEDAMVDLIVEEIARAKDEASPPTPPERVVEYVGDEPAGWSALQSLVSNHPTALVITVLILLALLAGGGC